MEIDAVVVSKDRAFQLDALFSSIVKFAPQIQSVKAIVKTSTPDFERGYQELWNDWRDSKKGLNCEILGENGFKNSIMQALKDSQAKVLCTLTDDSIFFRPLTLDGNQLFDFFQRTNCNAFAPRCGYNTQQQCHWQPIFQKKIEPVTKDGELIVWDFTQHDYGTDYGRPISIDGNMYPMKLMYQIMEENVWDWCGDFDGLPVGKLGKYLSSYEHSILTNIPVNSTHGARADNWGKYYTQTFEELNQMYLEGKRNDIDKMDFSNVIGGHQEIPYVV